VGLADANRILDALDTNRTASADGLGLPLPHRLLFSGLWMIGSEEEAGVLPAACRLPLPSVLPTVSRHPVRPSGHSLLRRASHVACRIGFTSSSAIDAQKTAPVPVTGLCLRKRHKDETKVRHDPSPGPGCA
jgi:hypothetical protein